MRCRAATSFVLVCLCSTASGARADEPAPTPRGARRVGMVISGGGSLGNYEGGLNWVLVEYMRRQKPRAVPGTKPGGAALDAGRELLLTVSTGASAGNINALLNAIAYCGAEADTVNANPYYSTWLGMGIEELTQRYDELPGEPDGLLSQFAVRRAAKTIGDWMQSRRYVNCQMPIGITLTPLQPVWTKFGELSVVHQRNSVLATIATTPGTGMKVQRLLPSRASCADDSRCADQQRRRDAAIGLEALLPGTPPETAVDHVQLLNAVQASTAVQVLFGAKYVAICVEAPGAPPRGGCPAGRRLERVPFTDGGFFDNAPLGLAFALGSMPDQGKATDEYVFIEPVAGPELRATEPHCETSPSGGPSAPGAQPQAPPQLQSLRTLWGLIANLVRSARQYELATVTRYWSDQEQSVLSTRRHHPLIGERLAMFGAFMARAFREYDYYVGVADGLYFVSERICSGDMAWRRDGWQPPADRSCHEAVLDSLRANLGLLVEDAGGGPSLVCALLNRTLASAKQGKLTCDDAPFEDRSFPLLALLDSAVQRAHHSCGWQTGDRVETMLLGEGFGRILASIDPDALRAALSRCEAQHVPYCENRQANARLIRLVEEPEVVFRELLVELIARQQAIERKSPEGAPELLGYAEAAAHQEGLVAGIRSVVGGSARGAWNLLPYQVSLDAVRGGIDVGYQLCWPCGRRVALFPHASYWVRADGSPQHYFRGGLNLAIRTSFKSFMAPTIELGPGVHIGASTDALDTLGAQLGLDFLADKLRLHAAYYPGTGELGIFIGFGDIPGMFDAVF